METYLPRRRFLTGSAFVVCGLLLPRAYGILPSASADAKGVVLTKADKAIIAQLAAYSPDVYLWGGPVNFVRPKLKNDGPVTRSVNFLVRVADVPQLSRYLNSKSLDQLGVVYAGGPNLGFIVGTTGYTVTNYGPEDFSRVSRLAGVHAAS